MSNWEKRRVFKEIETFRALIGMKNVRKKARDFRRTVEIEQIQVFCSNISPISRLMEKKLACWQN